MQMVVAPHKCTDQTSCCSNDDEAFERLKTRWFDAGQPHNPDWAELLKDIESKPGSKSP